jgi:glycosyltransferase involved in cell wall biosynthesis
MASKTPVVAAHSSSIPEVCGKAAEYFDPLNCGEMAAKMQQVFNEESLRRELIAKGLKQIHKYNWRECAQATLQVIKKVLD